MFKGIKYILWLFIAVIVIVAVGMTYRDIVKNLPAKKKELFYDGEPKLKICLYYAVWCGHCEKYLDSKIFMTTYDELKKSGQFDNVVFVQLDYDKNKESAKKYGIAGFPSIVAIGADGSLLDEFRGDRYDKQALKDFVTSNLQKL